MSKRFRIAFSFAGEKRGFVAKAAAILARRFGEPHILYDKYHEAEFARSDLAFHLPPLYLENSDLVVVVLCKDYETKEWPGLEWRAIYGLIKQRKDEEVLLCRFDRAEVRGLYGLAGFIELDEREPDEVATLILERLAINEGQPKDYYAGDAPPGPDSPDIPAPQSSISDTTLKESSRSELPDVPYPELWLRLARLFGFLHNTRLLLLSFVLLSASQLLLYQQATGAIGELTGSGIGPLTALAYVIFAVTVGSPLIFYSSLQGGLGASEVLLVGTSLSNTVVFFVLLADLIASAFRRVFK